MKSKNATAQLKIFKDHHKKDICFNDSLSDIFIMFQTKIIPLHKEVIENSLYLKQNASLTNKMIFVNSDLDFNALLKVLASLYGYPLQFDRGIRTAQIFQVVMFLKVEEIQNALLEDIYKNFEDYAIFTLFDIASKYEIMGLQKKCFSQLVNLNFQQLQINKFDLLNVSKQTFLKIVKGCQMLKQKKDSPLLKEFDIKKLIKQYFDNNLSQKQSFEAFSSTFQEDQCSRRSAQDFDSFEKSNKELKKRKYTWNCPKIGHKDQTKPVKRRQTEDFTTISNYKQKSVQIKSLQQKNSEILVQSEAMLSQIVKVKKSVETLNYKFEEEKREQKIAQGLLDLGNILDEQSERLKKIQSDAFQLFQKKNKRR